MKTEVIIDYTDEAFNFIKHHHDVKNSKAIVNETILWFKAIPHAYSDRSVIKCGFLNMHYKFEHLEDACKFTITKFSSIS